MVSPLLRLQAAYFLQHLPAARKQMFTGLSGYPHSLLVIIVWVALDRRYLLGSHYISVATTSSLSACSQKGDTRMLPI